MRYTSVFSEQRRARSPKHRDAFCPRSCSIRCLPTSDRRRSRSAIDLDVFTAIDDGDAASQAIATRSGAAERGVRILCDYLSTIGLLTKADGTYRLTPESAAFLSKRSPAYLGTTARFLLRPELKQNFEAFDRGGPARWRAAVRRQHRL